jgi:RNA polymerase sigma factor (sigma-70 family)
VKFSDKEIIQAIREGKDEKVVASLYSNILPVLTKYICMNKGTPEDAYDLFQDALLIFVKMVATNKFDSDKYQIYPFILTVTKNLWINKVRKKGRGIRWEKTKLEEEEDMLILENMIDDERKKVLDLLFSSLGKSCIEILTLFYYQELSMKEIAEKMNLKSADVAKLKAYRCRKELSNKVASNNYLLEQLKKG